MIDEPTPPTVSPLAALVGPLIPWLQALGVVVGAAIMQAALEQLLALLTGAYPDQLTGASLSHMLRASLAAGVIAALAYLKKSPLTRHEWTEEERAAERAKLEAQGRLPR